MSRYDASIARRRDIARIYDSRLAGLEAVLLPPGPDSDDLRFDIFQNYEVQADRREELREHLATRGIGTILQWGGHMIHQFDDLALRSDAAYAEGMSKRFMLLPLHPMLSDDNVNYVCDNVLAFYGQ